MTAGPLAGIRVLEFSQIVAAPFLGCILSDLGADVVKVEPLAGDQHRSWGAVVPGEGKRFQSLNRGKRGIALDLQQPAGREVIRRLLPAFDVVTNNYRSGVAERLGIDYATLRALRPDLIYCEINGWGHAGPIAGDAAADPVVCAYSGLTAADAKLGDDGAPLAVSCAAISDYAAGFSAAIGVLAALYHRALTGEGQLVEASLLRSALAIQDTTVMREPVADATLRDPMLAAVHSIRTRGGAYREVIAARAGQRMSDTAALKGFNSAYETADGVLWLGAVTPKNRNAVRALLGITDDRAESPDFDASDPASIAYGDRRKAHIAQQLRTRTTYEWFEAFRAAGVPVAPVQLPEEMADDPQVVANGFMTPLVHPITGPQQVASPVVTLSATPTAVRKPSPTLGEDTTALLAEAGFTPAEIAALRASDVAF